MTLLLNTVLEGENAGRNIKRDVRIAVGQVALAVGVGSEVVPGFTANAIVAHGYAAASFVGANAGILNSVYNPATGAVEIASSNAADDNNVMFILIEQGQNEP